MSLMAGGSETTREERFVYSEEVQKLIDRALSRIEELDARGPKLADWDVKARKRSALETLVWSAVRHAEDDGAI